MDIYLASIFVGIGVALGIAFSIFACRWAFKPVQGDGKMVWHRGYTH